MVEPEEEARHRAVKAEIQRDEAAIGEEQERSGCHILATNVLPKREELTDDELLAEHKGATRSNEGSDS